MDPDCGRLGVWQSILLAGCLKDGRWWYLLSGYTYRHDAVCQIDGQAYAFDSDGWMITADRIAEDGHIR
ncbi:MAG: hypothetical protein ACLR8P_13155 [Clostridium fessum]